MSDDRVADDRRGCGPERCGHVCAPFLRGGTAHSLRTNRGGPRSSPAPGPGASTSGSSSSNACARASRRASVAAVCRSTAASWRIPGTRRPAWSGAALLDWRSAARCAYRRMTAKRFSAVVHKVGINPCVDVPAHVISDLLRSAGKKGAPVPAEGESTRRQLRPPSSSIKVLRDCISIWKCAAPLTCIWTILLISRSDSIPAPALPIPAALRGTREMLDLIRLLKSSI